MNSRMNHTKFDLRKTNRHLKQFNSIWQSLDNDKLLIRVIASRESWIEIKICADG